MLDYHRTNERTRVRTSLDLSQHVTAQRISKGDDRSLDVFSSGFAFDDVCDEALAIVERLEMLCVLATTRTLLIHLL